MLQRCANPNIVAWHQYGGRGITVCERWREFEAFFADMGLRPDGTTLDRINCDGNYEPWNCRWATKTEQQRNRRDCNTYTLNGETLTLQGWSERTGISFQALRGRWRAGWPADRALTLPATKANSVLRSRREHKRDAAGRFQRKAV
jgi:hypothetical protein